MKLLLLLWAGCGFAVLSVQAQNAVQVPLGDPNAGGFVEMSAVFSDLPLVGYAPVVVQVRNLHDRDLNFRVKALARQDAGYSGDHEYASEWSLAAKKESTSTHSLLIPIGTENANRGYYGSGSSSLQLDLSGESSLQLSLMSSLTPDRPAVALSQGLTGGLVRLLNGVSEIPGKSYPYGKGAFAAQFSAARLPEDWRACTGFDFVALRTDEWLKLAPGVRTGLLQWVQLGGILDIYTSSGETADTLRLPPAREDGGVGFGMVRIQPWNGSGLNPAELIQQYSDHPSAMVKNQLELFRAASAGPWSQLIAAFGGRSFNAWQVGLVLLIFGILVGPVNLFHFARTGKRHRLFFTTPVISLAASLILLGVIFFQDGIGGQGIRCATVYLNSVDSTAFIRQSSLARTGVLFSSGFRTPEPSFISPVILPDSQWTRLKDPGRTTAAQRYTMPEDQSYAGGWFQSRSEQALAIETVRSTRGRVELDAAADQPPRLRSSLGYPLESLWYCDAAGGLWTSSGPLATGQAVTLQKTTPADYEKWRRAQFAYFDPVASRLLQASHPPRGHFLASATAATPEMIDTLSSIQWTHNALLLWGPVPQIAP
ncbi:MAG: hypothetical protein KA004_16555 [Verrucomicrobiales bacterium]|nr:hypothetical protein [Verrucomicrobiales bacterium]